MSRATSSATDHDRLLRELAPRLGIDWRKYRRRQSRRGLVRRMEALRIHDLAVYRRRLLDDPGEADLLVASMRITVSRFLRDPGVWRDLMQLVVPGLLARVPAGEALRAWSAGCASGEEPYTLAVLWDGLPQSLRQGKRLEILATDIDPAVLARARAGLFPSPALAPLPASLRRGAFIPEMDGRRVAAAVRERVRFEAADLLHGPAPHDCHLVLCRYLACTYFRGARLRQALATLCAALAPGGALVVGRKETLPPEAEELLEPWPGAGSIYRLRTLPTGP